MLWAEVEATIDRAGNDAIRHFRSKAKKPPALLTIRPPAQITIQLQAPFESRVDVFALSASQSHDQRRNYSMNASLFSPVSGRLKLAYRRFAGSQPSWRRWHRHARPGLVPQPEALEGRTLLSRGGYGFTTLDDPNAGTEFFQGTYSNGINNRGQITGAYVDASDVDHGFLLSHGQYTALDDPNAGTIFGQGTSAEGINDPGQVAGYYADSSNLDHGFVLAKGQYATLDDPSAGTTPGQGTYAFGINNPGQIVGFYVDANNAYHGFVLSNGQYTTLDDPNASTLPNLGTAAEGINNSGEIVGVYFDANSVTHGYLVVNGQYITIDDPNAGTAPGEGTAAYGINNRGEIVGEYTDANFVTHGFVLSHGQFTTLNDPTAGNSGTVAIGINDNGQIVGNFIDASLVIHGFLATPGGGDALLGASDNLLPNEAANNTASLGSQLVSAARTSRANQSDALGDRSSGQTSAIATVPRPLQSAVDPGVTVSGARRFGSRLLFGSKTY